MRIIDLDFYADKGGSIFLGYAGEHLSTVLNFHMPAKLGNNDCVYIISFLDDKDSSEEILNLAFKTRFDTNIVEYYIPNTIMGSAASTGVFQLIAYGMTTTDNNQVKYSILGKSTEFRYVIDDAITEDTSNLNITLTDSEDITMKNLRDAIRQLGDVQAAFTNLDILVQQIGEEFPDKSKLQETQIMNAPPTMSTAGKGGDIVEVDGVLYECFGQKNNDYIWKEVSFDDDSSNNAVAAFDSENDEVIKYMSAEPQTDSEYTYSNVNMSLSERKDIPGAFSVTLPADTAYLRIVDCQSGNEWKENAGAGEYEIRNLIPNRIYRYYVLKANGTVLGSGSCVGRGQVRMIDVPKANGERNVFNIRDLGGWACSGGFMKYGLIFRGGRLNGTNPSVSGSAIELTEQQTAYFKNVLHIADEIDLRTSNEISQDGISGSALGEDVSWINKTLGYYQNSLTDSNSANYAVLINRLAENLTAGKVTYIHCNSGADRTAQLCMFIEAICGVSLIDMERDYELTSYAFEYRSGQIDRRRNKITNACWKTFIQALDSEAGNTIQEKAVNFLLSKGVTSSTISTIREKLVENNGGDIDISGKADKATTLSGYGIVDAYTKAQVDEVISNIDGDSSIFAKPEDYGAIGDGVTDDTVAIQECINSNNHIFFEKSYLINPWTNSSSTKFYGLLVPSNRILSFGVNSKLICANNEKTVTSSEKYDEFDIIKVENSENVLIKGMKLKGERRPELIGYGDHSACLLISGSKNITIENCKMYNSLGDGIGIWGYGTEWEYNDGNYQICEDIDIINCDIRENRRNGLTIGCGKNIRVINCDFIRNGNKVDYGDEVYGYGRKPRAGVDIEPNFAYIPVENVVFEKCLFSGNAKDGDGSPSEQNSKAYSFIDHVPSKPTNWDSEQIKNAVLASRKNLTLSNCTITDSEAVFQAANTNVIGGFYQAIIISSIPTVKVSGATINSITSAAPKNNTFFTGCTIIGHNDDSPSFMNGKINCWIECFSCNIIEAKADMARTGTLGLYDCYVYKTSGKFNSTGHLVAKNTQFHFEEHEATSSPVFHVMSGEFINCDFFYPSDVRFELFGLTNTTDSEYYRKTNWIGNRFHNALNDTNSLIDPLGNDLIKNWFNMPSTKLKNADNISRVDNIWTDLDEARYDKADITYVNSELAKKADIVNIPTKTSQLQNDSGFLTSHQDITGKENVSNKVTSISSSSTNTQYPSALAVKNYVDTALGVIENGSY